MGGADVVPGVSGGTVALILGIYERLILSISAVVGAAASLARADVPRTRRRLGAVEWTLVLPLAGGIAAALIVGSIVIPPLIERYPVNVHALFFGLVAGSLPIPWRRMERVGLREWAVLAAAAVVAFVLVGLPPRAVAHPAPSQVFGAAAVAITAMILPGVSGAFLLKALGMYEVSLGAIRDLDIGYVAVFLAGAALGLGMFAKLLGWLLDRHHAVTMAALVGLMVGALRALWPWLTDERRLLAPPSLEEGLVAAAIAVAGILAVLALTRAGTRGHVDVAERP
jgi:putative membrane protein